MRMKHNKRLWGKISLLLAILIVVGVAVSGCYGRNQPRGWSGATVVDDTLFVASVEGRLVALNASDGSRLWPDSVLGTSESKTAIYGTPAVEGELVYLGGYNGKVYAVTAGSGAVRWAYPREGNLEPIVGGVVVSQGRVYFGSSDGKVYTLDAATGDKVRQPFQTGDKIWSTPTIDGETIYVTSLDNKLYALNTANGSERWRFEAGGAIISTPLVYDNTVYIGSFDGHFYAVDAADGSLRWRSEIEATSWFWAKPVVYNNVIYAPCLDGKVYILDAKSGHEVIDAIDLGSPISSGPVVVNGKVIIASQEGKVYSVDASNNQKGPPIIDVREEIKEIPKDNEREICAPLGAADEVVYIHAQNPKKNTDTLYALNVETGVTLWSLSLSSK